MALKLVYDKVDEVPAEFATLYTEKDGKFHFTAIDGLKTAQDVANVQEALRKEREEHGKTKTKLKDFEGIDPSQYKTEMDELTDFRARKAAGTDKPDPKAIQDAVEAGIARVKAPLERENQQLKQKIGDLEKGIGETTGELTRTKLDVQVRAAASKAKVVDTAMDDIAQLSDRLFTLAPDGKAVTKEGVGVTPGVTLDTYFEEMKDKKPHWWPASVGGGSNTPNGQQPNNTNNPWAKGQINLTEQGKMVRQNRAHAEKLARAAGVNIDGTPLKQSA